MADATSGALPSDLEEDLASLLAGGLYVRHEGRPVCRWPSPASIRHHAAHASHVCFRILTDRNYNRRATSISHNCTYFLTHFCSFVPADKEALMSCLASSHEGRVARILKREGDLKAREDKRLDYGH